ncbi:MAG TPA: hypothetical protein ENN77_00730 [Candidatus Wirthbacteria bacterium]|nr:hypothetical protein [Candidatus Wirthbacteria bacterium]
MSGELIDLGDQLSKLDEVSRMLVEQTCVLVASLEIANQILAQKRLPPDYETTIKECYRTINKWGVSAFVLVEFSKIKVEVMMNVVSASSEFKDIRMMLYSGSRNPEQSTQYMVYWLIDFIQKYKELHPALLRAMMLSTEPVQNVYALRVFADLYKLYGIDPQA